MSQMNVLIIGSGGREHALAWKTSQSAKVNKLYAIPGSDAIAEVAVCESLRLSDHEAIVAFAKDKDINLVIVGPEQPLVEGLSDGLSTAGIRVFGPSKAAAAIEGSKQFAKDLMNSYKIPTAAYEVFTETEKAREYILAKGAPIVLKADGLAAGKGVVVAMNEQEALDALEQMLESNAFGDAGHRVVIEEYLEGEEFSLMALVNGTTVVPLEISQDHKRAFEEDQGPNTGGMGAYSPVPQIPAEAVDQAMTAIVQPVADAMVQDGCSFTGFLYAGLMLTADGPKVIEFNCRMGDPETQVILPRLESDLVEAILAVMENRHPALKWSNKAACGVVLAAEGYPAGYKKGHLLENLDILPKDGRFLFHAGTKKTDQGWASTGGRILLVGCLEPTLHEAVQCAEKMAGTLQAEHTFYRKDIGFRAINFINE